jgi:hypothetical protein
MIQFRNDRIYKETDIENGQFEFKNGQIKPYFKVISPRGEEIQY